MNSLFNRCSIRRFTNEPLTEEQINLLMKAAFSAPSAKNAQPWEFILVTDPRKLHELSDLSPYAKPISGSALGIIVCANLNRNEMIDFCEQDCAAATQNILLEATELGLGGVWLGMYPAPGRSERLKVVFNLPDKIVPLWMLAIGHPDEQTSVKDKWNDAYIHYEEW